MKIGERIKQLREKAGLSQRELASKLGIAPQTYNPIEKSDSIPSDRLIKIAQVLGVSIEALLGASLGNAAGQVLSFVNQKGGVGKTTLAILYATMYASLHPDKKVCIIDSDFQQSVVKQENDDKRQGLEPIVAVYPFIAKDSPNPVMEIMDLIQDCEAKYDLVVIDTIGSVTDVELISTIILFSDVCIIPVQPSKLALNSTVSTISMINEIRESNIKKRKAFKTKILITIAKQNLESRSITKKNSIFDVQIMENIMKDKTTYIRDISLVEPIDEFKDIFHEISDLF